MSSPSVASDATSATLTLDGTAGGVVAYYWRYRLGSSGDGSYIENTPSDTVNFSASTANPEIQYCVAEKPSSSRDDRNWNCDTLTIERNPPPNKAPVISAISNRSINHMDSTTVTVSVDDENTSTVLLSASDNTDPGVVDITKVGDNSFRVSGASPGTSTITIEAQDEFGATDTETFEVTVVEVESPDTAPVIAEISDQSMIAGTNKIINVLVEDEDPGSVSLSVTGNSNSDAVSVLEAGPDTLQVFANSVGTSQITVRATDNNGKFDTETFSVDVKDSAVDNTAPIVSGLSDLFLAFAESRSLALTVLDENPDTVELSVHSNSNPFSVLASLDGNTLKVQALLPGSSTIEIRAKDEKGSTGNATFTVNVGRVSSQPVILDIVPGRELVLDVGAEVVVELDVDDSEEDDFKFSARSSNSAVATIEHQGDGKYQVRAVSQGTAVLTVDVTNSADLKTEATIDVSVNAVVAVPVAFDDQFVFDFLSETQELDVLVNDSDGEGSTLTIVLDSAQTSLGGTISLGADVVSYIPPPSFTRQDSFSYQIMDAAGNLSNRASVSILPSDTDGDGTFDGSDNCPIFANERQLDSDNDMIGDLCDPDPDGDGDLGEAGNPFTTGKSLVESICLDCHQDGLEGSPAFGDTQAWRARVTEAGGIPPLLDSVSLGKGAMPAWGREYSARELTQAILYMTGLEDPALSGDFIDRDLDGVNDLIDNCINHPNADQLDSDNNGIGNDCEPDADNDGVLDYSLSFQFFQETPAGRVTGGIVQAGAGQVTVLARTRSEIPGLSYNWNGSDAAILALFEGAPTDDVVTFSPTAENTGVYNLEVAIQGSGIQGKTRARLVIVESPLVDDLADLDYDGYPASLDNDNANANRILSESGANVSSSVFYSDQSITLGAFTAQQAASSRYSAAKATLSQAEFLAAAQRRYPDVTPIADSTIDNSIGVMDFELRDLDSDSANIRLKLLGNIPLNASLRVYNPRSGSWRNFSGTGSDSIASAPLVAGECPANDSPNYTNGLIAGQGCVRFRLTDGGPNDSDGVRDGVIAMTGVIGSLLSDPTTGNSGPGDVDVSPSRSGGGALSWLAAMLLLTGIATRRVPSSVQ
ncbi:MAG: Ig-like domain-containing protein [Granulosicoccus sp.]